MPGSITASDQPLFRELYTERPPEQPAQPVEQDENAPSLFEMPPVVEHTPEHDQLYAPYRKQFYENFARQFNSRRFTGLADYENWLRNLPGSVVDILPYVQEIGEKYMPTAARQEYELKQSDKAARQKIRMSVGQMKAMQEEMEKQGLPFNLTADSQGRIVPKPINDAATKKANDSRLKTLMGLRDKATKPEERTYLQEQIDSLMTGENPTTGQPGASGGASSMTKAEFMQDYTVTKGRPPTEAQIEAARQRGYWR